MCATKRIEKNRKNKDVRRLELKMRRLGFEPR